MRDQIAKAATGLRHIGRQPVHLNISRVATDEPLGWIEQGKALRHIVDGDIEVLLF